MSDSDEVIELDGAKCQQLCEQFAVITNTDNACAQFYLQDREWNLERSINDFFEHQKNKGSIQKIDGGPESEVVVVLDGSQASLAAAATAVIAETATASTSDKAKSTAPSLKSSLESQQKNDEIKFVTWNIDGLCEKNLKLRTKAVCNTIKQISADIVFLQEVVSESAEDIMMNLPDYNINFAQEIGYFTAILTKKGVVTVKEHKVIEFPNSSMGRNISVTTATFKNIPLRLFNTHLESTGDFASIRKQQLKASLKHVLDSNDEETVIFAGDLNLRDKELTEIGGLPAGVEDMWITCGSRKECTYTWDMMRNDNLVWNGRFKPRCRFDRVYVRHSSPGKLTPHHFGLIGLERLLPHRCFPSDHWGILCLFKIE